MLLRAPGVILLNASHSSSVSSTFLTPRIASSGRLALTRASRAPVGRRTLSARASPQSTGGLQPQPILYAQDYRKVYTMAEPSAPYVAMPTVSQQLHDVFRTALATAFPQLTGTEPILAACAQLKFGDYQCNNAMPLFNQLKGKDGAPKAPRDVSTAIINALPADGVLITKTSIAGPGFINLTIGRPYLANRIATMLTAGIETWAPAVAEKRVIVDFSAPNVAKEMHVGHLRSTILGETVCRTLEYCRCDVVRLNHIGDWGTAFGMLITYMAETQPAGGPDGNESISDLMALYRAAKQRFDADEAFKTASREAVTRLQSGDPASLASWRKICDASRKDFELIYQRLGVTITERGESFYNPMLKDTVDELMERGVAVVSDGAKCVFVEGSPNPLMVQKTDGGYGYASTDMACIKHRIFTEKADWLIYITDCGQAGHFDMVFAAARKMGWLPPKETPRGEAHPRVSHIGFGLVMGEDGKKFRTRSGDTVRLVELLDEAKARVGATIAERRAENKEEISAEELELASCAMGYGAVKYADLKNHRMTNYKFNYDEMLNLKGNTAVYLLYAHARIAGIVRKSGRDIKALSTTATLTLNHPREADVGLHLCRFPEAVQDMLQDITPNRLTEYLYELSERFNNFYTECKVLGSDDEDSRLLLCEATAVVMRQCFYLLGITPLYRI